MIARMEKLCIVGPKRLAPTVLKNLQQAGVVQIDELPPDQMQAYQLGPEEEALLRGWEGMAISVDHASHLLGLEIDAPVEPFQGNLAEASATAAAYEQRAAALVEKRESLKDELQLINLYKEILEYLAEAVDGLDCSSRLSVICFLVERPEELTASEQELSSTLDDRYLLTRGALGNLTVAVIIGLNRDAETARGILARKGLHELPHMLEHGPMDLKSTAARLTERSQHAPEELAAVEKEIDRLRQEAGRSLKSLWFRAADETNRLRTFKKMGSGRYGFALCGWAPLNRKSRVVDFLERLDEQIRYTFEPADEDHEPERVPVMLENPSWAKPFEVLISFLNTPRYDGWDPTCITAALFPLWVGMVIGDMGYGLVFAALAWYLHTFVRRKQPLTIDFFKIRLAPEGVAQLLRVMTPILIWTMLWGFVYGEFFGDLLRRLGIFGTASYPGLIPILIPRTETDATATMLILVSIGFGVVQVLHGFVVKARTSCRNGERRHFWEGIGYFGGVAGLVLFAYAFMTHNYPLWLVIMMSAAFSLFVLGMVRAKMPLMIAELPTQGGHILSYIRIYAVGLASAILANLATDIGFALLHKGGIVEAVAGMLIGVALGILVHAILLVLLTVGHILQPIRLIWVEFFTKFDFYSLSGKPYRPFKLYNGKP